MFCTIQIVLYHTDGTSIKWDTAMLCTIQMVLVLSEKHLWKVLYSVSSKQNERWATQAQLSAEPLVFNFTHKGRKYLTIIEHISYFIIPFSCQNLSSIHAFVLHANGLKVDADYIPGVGSYLWRVFLSREFFMCIAFLGFLLTSKIVEIKNDTNINTFTVQDVLVGSSQMQIYLH